MMIWVCTLYGVRSYWCGRIFHFHRYALPFTWPIFTHHEDEGTRCLQNKLKLHGVKTQNTVEQQLQWKPEHLRFHFLTFQDLGGNVGPVLQNGHNLFITLHTCRHIKKWFHGITANMAVIYHAVYTMTHTWWITETCTLTLAQISTHSYHNNLYFFIELLVYMLFITPSDWLWYFHNTSHISNLCILYPWTWPHGWPNT